MSLCFEMVVGLGQGDALSKLLFNVPVEKWTMNVETNPRGSMSSRKKAVPPACG
jgi:hypothetical protein